MSHMFDPYYGRVVKYLFTTGVGEIHDHWYEVEELDDGHHTQCLASDMVKLPEEDQALVALGSLGNG